MTLWDSFEQWRGTSFLAAGGVWLMFSSRLEYRLPGRRPDGADARAGIRVLARRKSPPETPPNFYCEPPTASRISDGDFTFTPV
jgi:hypothetical protein